MAAKEVVEGSEAHCEAHNVEAGVQAVKAVAGVGDAGGGEWSAKTKSNHHNLFFSLTSCFSGGKNC